MPPRASAASCLTMSDSCESWRTWSKAGTECGERSWPKTKAISCLSRRVRCLFSMRLTARSLEQCTVVGEARSESVNRCGGAYVSQREHRSIALKEWELLVKKLVAKLLYRSTPQLCSARKEAGAGRSRIDRGVSSGLTDQRRSAQEAKIATD
jgi:hypothetical protein